MKLFKKFSLIFLSMFIFVSSAFVFVGCGKDSDECKLYVFASIGGTVKVDDHEEVVEFGDEGSKIFTYHQNNSIKLKALPNAGYRFVRWKFTETKEDYSLILSKDEIEINIVDEELVVKAEFELDGSVTTYDITYPSNQTGYTFNIQTGFTTSVIAGGEFKFKITLWKDYSDSNIVVKANNTVVNADNNGIYTLIINADTNITIEGVELNKSEIPDVPDNPNPTIYGVFTTDTRFTIVPKSQSNCLVEEGKCFIFSIELKDGYKFDGNPIVRVGNNVLPESNGLYIIESVDGNTEISISNIIEEPVIPNVYEIYTNSNLFNILPQGQSVAGKSWNVEEGENFTFTIQIAEGYIDAGIIVKANNIKLTSVSGVYTISSVSAKTEIIVEGIEPEALPTPEKYTITTIGNNFTITPVSHSGFEVSEGESFIFEIKPAEGYKFSDTIVVTASAIEVIVVDAEKHQYKIASVVSDMVIEVSGIVEDIPQPEMYTISTNSQLFTIVVEGQMNNLWSVEDGGSFVFDIKIADGYYAKNPIVKADGVMISKVNGKYKISSVVKSMEITVEGIEEDEVTYLFALTFNDAVSTQVWLPENIELTIKQSERKTQYNSSELVVIDVNWDESYTFEEIISLVNDGVGYLQVVGFSIAGLEFIKVDGDILTINWNILEVVGSNYELIVETKVI